MIKAGQRLKEERLKQGLTLDNVSKAIKIKVSFLEAIEKSEYAKLPSSTFAQGFVRNYTQFLKLPEEEIIPLFRREFDEEKIYRVLPQGLPDANYPISKMKKSQFILIPLLFLVLTLYLLFQYKDAIIPPNVNITRPSENQTLKSTLVLVSGETSPENVVFVNNFPVAVDDNGNFKKTISVFPGKSLITVKVVNRFNKTTVVTRHILVNSL